jgi:hypothetical protein
MKESKSRGGAIVATKNVAGLNANASSRTITKKKGGAAFNEQDPKRRLGNFSGAGEHARQGGRTSGIVGQTKQKNRTDKRRKK